MRYNRQRNYRVIRNTGPCYYCEESVEPSYKHAKQLQVFLTGKGKIQSRIRTGLCQKHQRRMARSVRQARQLALLPFVSMLK